MLPGWDKNVGLFCGIDRRLRRIRGDIEYEVTIQLIRLFYEIDKVLIEAGIAKM